MNERMTNEIPCRLCGSDIHSSGTHVAKRYEWIKGINKNQEYVTKARKRGPATLDIIKLDDRWAQTDNFTHAGLIKWLDSGIVETVDPEAYELNELYEVPLAELADSFTSSEIENVRWGPEQDAHHNLKQEVRVFGRYVKKINRLSKKEPLG